MAVDTRKEYETPELTKIGSFEEITQANGAQVALDASFPVNTPFDELTFS